MFDLADKEKEIKDETVESNEETKENLEVNVENEDLSNKDDKKNKDKSSKLEHKYQEEIKKLTEENKKLTEDNKNLRNEYLKCLAEVENTKKRLKDESIKDKKYSSQKVIGELINPIDMFVKILDMPTSNPEVSNYQIGFKMIANQLVDIMKGEGLAPIKSLGEKFDPTFMQAVETKEDLDKEEDIVLSVMQEGYMYKDRVLRPAMVVVNKKNKEEEKKEEE